MRIASAYTSYWRLLGWLADGVCQGPEEHVRLSEMFYIYWGLWFDDAEVIRESLHRTFSINCIHAAAIRASSYSLQMWSRSFHFL